MNLVRLADPPGDTVHVYVPLLRTLCDCDSFKRAADRRRIRVQPVIELVDPHPGLKVCLRCQKKVAEAVALLAATGEQTNG